VEILPVTPAGLAINTQLITMRKTSILHREVASWMARQSE
jgi:hypothetical protein